MHGGVLALVVILVVALAAPVLVPAPVAVARSSERRVCTKNATLYDTPRGFAIGLLIKRDRLRVLRRSANRRWYHVRVRRTQMTGWVSVGAVCRA